jgi:serine/threonine protein kinase
MKRLAQAPAQADLESWKSVLFPGAQIGRFELVREIGRGGFGVVYEARDRQLGRLVAFKAVRPGRNSLVMFRQQRLQLEAEAVAALTHPNIVSLFDLGSCEGGPYLIFELLRGETLFDRLLRGRLSLADALDIGIQIGWALDHAHAAGVVHRDLKPSNVFLCHGGQAKVLDFGIADVLGGGDLQGVGTPPYMAPEQWTGHRQDARTDVFGAATMLFESLTGRLPYRVSKDRSSALDPGAKPQLGDSALPPALETLLRAALAPEPARRPADGHAWVNGLLAVQQELEGTAELGVQSRATAPPAMPESRLAMAVAMGAALLAGALTLWLLLR